MKLATSTLKFLSAATILCCGCADPYADDVPPKAADQESNQNTTPESAGSIIGKKTQDVGQWDPTSGDTETDLKIDGNSNPLAAATGSYKFATATLSKQRVERDLQFFYTINERYPKDHAEFMEAIVKKGNIQFPVLPGKRRYQYDVENHVLRIVEAKKN
jgi:hypothetical protein